jgi:putative membrane protein
MFAAEMKSFLQRWVISTVAVLVATYIVPGIDYVKPLDLFVATLLLGILNTFLRPLLLLLSLPLLVFTLGLFTLVINALLLLLVSVLLQPKFVVDGFWSAFWGALIISIITLALNSLTGTGNSRISVKKGKAASRNDDDGPVIDV